MVDLLRIVEASSETVEPFRLGECWVRFCRLAGEWHCYVCDEERGTTRVIGVGLGGSPTFALADAHRWMVRHERVLSGAISALERLLEES